MDTKKKLNTFVWIGFALDLIGFVIALWVAFGLGLGIMLVGLVFSIIGLVLCVKQNGNVGTAAFYVILDVVFLIYLVFFLS